MRRRPSWVINIHAKWNGDASSVVSEITWKKGDEDKKRDFFGG